MRRASVQRIHAGRTRRSRTVARARAGHRPLHVPSVRRRPPRGRVPEADASRPVGAYRPPSRAQRLGAAGTRARPAAGRVVSCAGRRTPAASPRPRGGRPARSGPRCPKRPALKLAAGGTGLQSRRRSCGQSGRPARSVPIGVPRPHRLELRRGGVAAKRARTPRIPLLARAPVPRPPRSPPPALQLGHAGRRRRFAFGSPQRTRPRSVRLYGTSGAIAATMRRP
jgi:hypothetical protein